MERLIWGCSNILHYSSEHKRNFVETIELQIGIHHFEFQRHRRFLFRVTLPHHKKAKLKIAVLGGEIYETTQHEHGIPLFTTDQLRAYNRNAKLVKKLYTKYDEFLSPVQKIRQIPRLLGPWLHKVGKFPKQIDPPTESLLDKVNELQRIVSFKAPRHNMTMSTCIGSVLLSLDELVENVMVAIHGLVTSLQPYPFNGYRGWSTIGSVTLKSSMGPPQRIFKRNHRPK